MAVLSRMLMNLANLQPIDPPTDSTHSTESREMSEDKQRMVDEYTKKIVDAILDDPYASAAEIMKEVEQQGPCRSARSVAHLFGGVARFVETCDRMEGLRWAMTTHCWDRLPFPMDLQSREWRGQYRYSRKPDSNNDWVTWWAPDVHGVEPFEPMELRQPGEGVLYRFPEREDVENILDVETGSSDREMTSEDEEMPEA